MLPVWFKQILLKEKESHQLGTYHSQMAEVPGHSSLPDLASILHRSRRFSNKTLRVLHPPPLKRPFSARRSLQDTHNRKDLHKDHKWSAKQIRKSSIARTLELCPGPAWSHYPSLLFQFVTSVGLQAPRLTSSCLWQTKSSTVM